jgi:hypothetical protein
MRFECYGCKKSFSGQGLIVNLHGDEQVYCADCLWALRKEYDKKKTCEDCAVFDDESCTKTGETLKSVKIGFKTYYVQAETCQNYSTEEKTNPKKKSEVNEQQKEAKALAKNLAEKGENIRYFCCHCGAPLQVGAKSPEIQDICPRCGCDLEIINMAKLIKQHRQ